MVPRWRVARPADCAVLVELMSEFYGESGYSLDRRQADRAFRALLEDSRLGAIWLLEDGSLAAGYVVLTLGYSMEYGGSDGFVDDLFIRAPFRGRGLGKAALAEVRAACLRLGVRALHLEVGRENDPARRLYRQAGFVDHDRLLLTLRLANPTHTSEPD